MYLHSDFQTVALLLVMLQLFDILIDPREDSLLLGLGLQKTFECLNVVLVIGVELDLDVDEGLLVGVLLDHFEQHLDIHLG